MRFFCAFWVLLAILSTSSQLVLAEEPSRPYRGVTTDSLDALDDPALPVSSKRYTPVEPVATASKEEPQFQLPNNTAVHAGVDLGVMIPFGDYQKLFASAPMLGLHVLWQAAPPFAFTIGMERSAAPNKDSVQSGGKLTLNSINLGAQATLPSRRFAPFVKLESSFQFNSVNFNDGRTIVRGDDLNLTTVGVNLGVGFDLLVGREITLGFIVNYHLAIPKQLLLSDGSNFDLGSPYVTSGIRIGF